MADKERLEDKLNRLSKEPRFGEGVVTLREQAEMLEALDAVLESGKAHLVGRSIVGAEVPIGTRKMIGGMNEDGDIGASIFYGERMYIVTEDGGVLVIGDGCMIANTTIRVAEGAVLMVEDSNLINCEIIVAKGEHKIVSSKLNESKLRDSSLHYVWSKDSIISVSLIREMKLSSSSLVGCIGSAGGAEVGGIYQRKSFSYYLDPVSKRVHMSTEDLKEGGEKVAV